MRSEFGCTLDVLATFRQASLSFQRDVCLAWHPLPVGLRGRSERSGTKGLAREACQELRLQIRRLSATQEEGSVELSRAHEERARLEMHLAEAKKELAANQVGSFLWGAV